MYLGAFIFLHLKGKKAIDCLRKREHPLIIVKGKMIGIILFSIITCIPLLIKEHDRTFSSSFFKNLYLGLERSLFLLLTLIYLKIRNRDFYYTFNYWIDLFFSPLCEELSFRFYLLSHLKCNVYLMASLFSISHCITPLLYRDAIPFPQMIITFLYGLFVGDLFLRIKNQWIATFVCFVSHSFSNFISFPSNVNFKDPFIYLCLLISAVYFCFI